MITPYTTKAHQRYYVDGKRVSGASTIAKLGRDNTSLQDWAYNMGLEGLDKDEYFQMSGRVGTIAHALLQAYVTDDELDLTGYSEPDQELGRKLGQKFCKKWDRSGLEFVATELQITSNALRYGGTLDLLGRRPDNGLTLVDAKTSRNIYDSHAFQVAGYRNLWNEEHPDDLIDEVEIWCFSKEGKTFSLELDSEGIGLAWKVFQRQLDLLNALKGWDKRK